MLFLSPFLSFLSANSTCRLVTIQTALDERMVHISNPSLVSLGRLLCIAQSPTLVGRPRSNLTRNEILHLLTSFFDTGLSVWPSFTGFPAPRACAWSAAWLDHPERKHDACRYCAVGVCRRPHRGSRCQPPIYLRRDDCGGGKWPRGDLRFLAFNVHK